jgi:hypothetical protein
VRVEEGAHGDRQETLTRQTGRYPLNPLPLYLQLHPLKVLEEWGREKRRVEGSDRKNVKRHERDQ